MENGCGCVPVGGVWQCIPTTRTAKYCVFFRPLPRAVFNNPKMMYKKGNCVSRLHDFEIELKIKMREKNGSEIHPAAFTQQGKL